MANEIRLKRGSGSDQSASDLVTGEVAIRTDNGKLFTKKDDGTVAEISGSGGGGGETVYMHGSYYGRGGNGGSGICVIRYTGGTAASGGSISSSGGYTYHTFNGTGTFTVS